MAGVPCLAGLAILHTFPARVPHPNVALFATLGWDSTSAGRMGF